MFIEFLEEDDGAQVIEYALIIAVLSIALVLALQPVLIATDLTALVSRIGTCLTTGVCP